MLRLMTNEGIHVSDFTDNIQLCSFLKATKVYTKYRVLDIQEKDGATLSEMTAFDWVFYNGLTMLTLTVQDLQTLHAMVVKLDAQLNPKPVEPPKEEPAPIAQPT